MSRGIFLKTSKKNEKVPLENSEKNFRKSKSDKIIVMLLIVVLAISSYFFLKEYIGQKNENDIYKNLQDDVKSIDNSLFNNNENNEDLVKYKNYNFYKNHKYIKFYTLSENKEKSIENTYEIVFAFKTIAYSDNGFKYYEYTNFKEKSTYNEFVENCRKLQLYDTGVNSSNEDKYITLSTCEYSQKNGRIVVVGKKIK